MRATSVGTHDPSRGIYSNHSNVHAILLPNQLIYRMRSMRFILSFNKG